MAAAGLREAARRGTADPRLALEAEMKRVWATLDHLDDAAARRILAHVVAMRQDVLDRLAALPTAEIDGVETFQATALRTFAAELEALGRRFALRAGLDLAEDLRAAAAFSDDAHRAALGRLAAALGRPPALLRLAPLGLSDAQLEAAVLLNTQAIRGVSERMAAAVNAEVQRVVFGGQSRWDAVRAIRDQLAGEPGWARRPPRGKALGRLTEQAITIERTGLLMAFNLAADHAYREALEELPDLEVEWVAVPDKRVDPLCVRLNGARKRPRGTFPGGVIAPPRHPRCRCRTVAALPAWGAGPLTPPGALPSPEPRPRRRRAAGTQKGGS